MNLNDIEKARYFITHMTDRRPKIAIILGSGLGSLGEEVKDKKHISYSKIPGFPVSTVQGHDGKLIYGTINGIEVVLMSGRFHFYEGYNTEEITFPIRVLKELGVKKLIITNASGGVNENFNPGDFMIIKDHINFGFNNPLIGKNEDSLGERFPDMTYAYDREYIEIAIESAKKLGINIKEGVYFYNQGPTYETPAEVRMIRILGGDAVGMSTVPEVIVARHAGMSVLGISCITNMAAGILDKELTHEEVIYTGEKTKNKFEELIKEILKRI